MIKIIISLLFLSFFMVASAQTGVDPVISGYEKVWENPPSKIFLFREVTNLTQSYNLTITMENNVTHQNTTTTTKKDMEVYKYGDYIVVNEDGTIFDAQSNDLVCKPKGVKVECDSKLDGNGDGICQQGESCVVLKNAKIEYYDHLADKYQQKWETQEKFSERKAK